MAGRASAHKQLMSGPNLLACHQFIGRPNILTPGQPTRKVFDFPNDQDVSVTTLAAIKTSPIQAVRPKRIVLLSTSSKVLALATEHSAVGLHSTASPWH